ncbi:MAG: XRE family transcriptional regulator [Phycisphaerales bacterium]|nr:XRE family transcriptional regulator [Phycisphaerales bacterium]
MDIGDVIRTKRLAQDLTQADLADRSGVSKAMICDVEGNKKNPTIRILGQIAAGLNCGISELLDLDETPAMELNARDHQRTLVDPENGMERRVLSRQMVRHGVEVLHYTYPKGADCSGFPAHPRGSIETAYVIEGRIRMSAGENSVELGPGDAVTYRADLEHSATNLGDGDARVVYVTLIPRAR